MGPPDRPDEMEEINGETEKLAVAVTENEDHEASSSGGAKVDPVETNDESESRSTEASGSAVPRKTFDLVVPPPISTSTRTFGASRPVSMSISGLTSSPQKTTSSNPSTPKKWVVNLPAPLAGFSSSPSPQTRLSERLSMRFDKQTITAALSSRTAPPTPPMTDDETTSSNPSHAGSFTPSPSQSFLRIGEGSTEASDDDGEYANPVFRLPTEPKSLDRESPILKSTSTPNIVVDGSIEDTLALDALVSPRYRPPVPIKSAAMLEKRRERAATITKPPPDPTPSPRLAPVVPERRKSAQFDRSAIRNSTHSLNTSDLPLTAEERAKLRANLAAELLKTEVFYVKSLKTIIASYLTPMRNSLGSDDPILPAEQQKLLFSNVEVLLGIHQPFEGELEGAVTEFTPTASHIGKALLSLVPCLKIYTAYVNNYNKSIHIYQDAMKHKSFRKFMTEAAVGNDLDNWPSYCIQPVQRIPKYLLILGELLKHTPEEHLDYADLKKAFDALTALANDINARKRDAENLTQCAHIQHMITYAEGVPKLQLVTQTRRYCREGAFEVFLNGISTPYNYLVLFNDALLITKSKRKQLRFDGFLLLANTTLQAFDLDDSSSSNAASSSQLQTSQPTVPGPSSAETSDEVSPNTTAAHSRSMSGPIPSLPTSSILPASSSASEGGSPAPSNAGIHPSASISLTLRSLVLNATVVILFNSQDDYNNWKQDLASACSKHDDIITPETFPDKIISLDSMSTSNGSDDITSPRKRSLSLGSSRSKKLRRLLTLGSSKSSKRDSTISTATTDVPLPSASPPSGDPS